jgi:glycosyltransferase involved in cell wall biosynthesis
MTCEKETEVSYMLQEVESQQWDDLGLDASTEQRGPRISVVIPALNEADNLPHVLPRIPTWIDEVLLVDGESSDDTVRVARELWPTIRVVPQMGRGKGAALRTGFAAATGDIIVMLDADGSADGREIPRFVDALIAGADVAKGSRFLGGGGSSDLTRLRRAGNRVLCGLVNVVYRTRYSDLCYGFNAGWVTALRRLHLDCAGFEVETMLSVRSAKSHLRITEVPSFEAPRLSGQSNLRTFRDGWRVLCTIVRERPRRRYRRTTLAVDAAALEPFIRPAVDPLPDAAAGAAATSMAETS